LLETVLFLTDAARPIILLGKCTCRASIAF
jgi:hypothetical protein